MGYFFLGDIKFFSYGEEKTSNNTSLGVSKKTEIAVVKLRFKRHWKP